MKHLIAGLLCVSITSASAGQAQNPCHSPHRQSAVLLADFRAMMSPAGAGVRAKLSLPVVPASEIVLVADSATCARAIQAADSMMTVWNPADPPGPTTYPIYVLRIGTSYAVVDLSDNSSSSEYASVFFFGPGWVFRRMLAM